MDIQLMMRKYLRVLLDNSEIGYEVRRFDVTNFTELLIRYENPVEALERARFVLEMNESRLFVSNVNVTESGVEYLFVGGNIFSGYLTKIIPLQRMSSQTPTTLLSMSSTYITYGSMVMAFNGYMTMITLLSYTQYVTVFNTRLPSLLYDFMRIFSKKVIDSDEIVGRYCLKIEGVE
jgi:hypothetical protein